MRIQYENFSLCVASVNVLAAPVKRCDNIQISLEKNEEKLAKKSKEEKQFRLHHCPKASICVKHWCRVERLHNALDTPNNANHSADRIVLSAPAMESEIFAPVHQSKYPKCRYCCRSMQIATEKHIWNYRLNLDISSNRSAHLVSTAGPTDTTHGMHMSRYDFRNSSS